MNLEDKWCFYDGVYWQFLYYRSEILLETSLVSLLLVVTESFYLFSSLGCDLSFFLYSMVTYILCNRGHDWTIYVSIRCHFRVSMNDLLNFIFQTTISYKCLRLVDVEKMWQSRPPLNCVVNSSGWSQRVRVRLLDRCGETSLVVCTRYCVRVLSGLSGQILVLWFWLS